MTLTLNRAFAANSRVDAQDTRVVKIALNRLGYYTPPRGIGITDIPDRGCFDALKDFQKDAGLRASGEMRMGDATITALNAATEEQEKSGGKYIWRTAGDEKVRESHAALEGTVQKWGEDIEPGEEANCRCWAEPAVGNCDLEEKNYVNALAAFKIAQQNLEKSLEDLPKLELALREIEKEIEKEKEERERAKDAGGVVGGVLGGKIGDVIGSKLPPPIRPGGEIFGEIIGEELGEISGVLLEEGSDIFTDDKTNSTLEFEKQKLEAEIQNVKDDIGRYKSDIERTGAEFETALSALAACEASVRL